MIVIAAGTTIPGITIHGMDLRCMHFAARIMVATITRMIHGTIPTTDGDLHSAMDGVIHGTTAVAGVGDLQLTSVLVMDMVILTTATTMVAGAHGIGVILTMEILLLL